jgi:flagellar biosynthesis protein FlhB
MAGAKIHPPSEQRVAEARRAGLAPRPVIAGLAAAWVTIVAGLRLCAPGLWQRVAELWRLPLEALALGDAARAFELARTLLFEIAGQLALLLAAAASCIALVSWLAQGPHFALPTRARRPFEAPPRSMLAGVLAALAACVVCAAFLSPALWLEPSSVGPLLARFGATLALVLALAALIDVAVARTAFLRALWMTRQELKEEQREAYGSPELRRARAHLRREELRASEQPRGSVSRADSRVGTGSRASTGQDRP